MYEFLPATAVVPPLTTAPTNTNNLARRSPRRTDLRRDHAAKEMKSFISPPPLLDKALFASFPTINHSDHSCMSSFFACLPLRRPDVLCAGKHIHIKQANKRSRDPCRHHRFVHLPHRQPRHARRRPLSSQATPPPPTHPRQWVQRTLQKHE